MQKFQQFWILDFGFWIYVTHKGFWPRETLIPHQPQTKKSQIGFSEI